MGKFDHLNKLQVEAELRKIELVPQKFWGPDVEELRARLAAILEDERQAEAGQVERRHREQLALAQDQLNRQLAQSDQQHQEQIAVAKRQASRAEAWALAALVVALGSAVATGFQAYYARPNPSSAPSTASIAAATPTPTARPTPRTTPVAVQPTIVLPPPKLSGSTPPTK
jgi:hypothetical protein